MYSTNARGSFDNESEEYESDFSMSVIKEPCDSSDVMQIKSNYLLKNEEIALESKDFFNGVACVEKDPDGSNSDIISTIRRIIGIYDTRGPWSCESDDLVTRMGLMAFPKNNRIIISPKALSAMSLDPSAKVKLNPSLRKSMDLVLRQAPRMGVKVSLFEKPFSINAKISSALAMAHQSGSGRGDLNIDRFKALRYIFGEESISSRNLINVLSVESTLMGCIRTIKLSDSLSAISKLVNVSRISRGGLSSSLSAYLEDVAANPRKSLEREYSGIRLDLEKYLGGKGIMEYYKSLAIKSGFDSGDQLHLVVIKAEVNKLDLEFSEDLATFLYTYIATSPSLTCDEHMHELMNKHKYKIFLAESQDKATKHKIMGDSEVDNTSLILVLGVSNKELNLVPLEDQGNGSKSQFLVPHPDLVLLSDDVVSSFI